jgi:WD40 repeat protein/serine/threonine protein kinase
MTNLVALPERTELAGDYRIERVLGAGGFGITYLAQEKQLERRVTIKEYFPVDFAARDPADDVCPRSQESEGDYQWGLDRFLAEAQTLAKFDHANIVRVYRYFRARKTGYIVLHFEEGQSLKAWLKGLGRAPRQQELDRIIAPLLDALDVIHAADFLHRDIAPDNIIIRKDGSPVLIDFGSARGELAKHSKTVSALVKPGYSPYEQYATSGRQQGPWTDIYSLAATLYQAVTGKRPPDAPSRIVVDEMIPVRDAALSSYRAGFLAAIDKALALDVGQRPRSVADWRAMLMAAPKAAESAPADAPSRAGPASEAPPQAASVRARKKQKTAPPPPAEPAKENTGPNAGLGAAFLDGWRKASAVGTLEKNATPVPVDVPAPPLPPPPTAVAPWKRIISFGRPAVPASVAKPAMERKAPPRALRKRPSWRPLVIKLGIGLAVAGFAVSVQDKFPQIRREGAGTVLSEAGDTVPIAQLKGHKGAVSGVAFSGDGRLIVTTAADATIKVWDATTRSVVRTLELDNGVASALAVDGRRAVTGHKDGTVVLWDIDGGAKVASFRRNDSAITSVAFAGDASRVVAAAQDGTVSLWDAKTPATPAQTFPGHDGAVYAVAFSARAPYVATGSADRTVKLWRGEGATPLRTYRGHADLVSALAFTPDGRSLASASLNGEIRLWSTFSSRLQKTLRGHTGRVTALTFSPDGEVLASASEDGSVRLWEVRRGRSARTLQSHTGELKSVGFAPDGRRIAAAGTDGLVRLWPATITKPGS